MFADLFGFIATKRYREAMATVSTGTILMNFNYEEYKPRK